MSTTPGTTGTTTGPRAATTPDEEGGPTDLGWLYTHPQVLVVDDDEDSRDLVAAMVERHGMTAVTAGDGDEALRTAMARPVDVVVLDVVMPGADGHAVCRTLLESVDESVPVIMMTSQPRKARRSASLRSGAVAHLRKPVRHDELLELIEGLI